MLASGKSNDPEPNKIATFLWLIGKRGVEIYNSLFPCNGRFENMFDVVDETASVPNVNIAANSNENLRATRSNNLSVRQRENNNIQQTLAQVIAAFDEYCVPRKNLAVEAFKFNMIIQKEKQTFGEFETELRTQLQYCEFSCASCHSSYADRILRDHIIVGIQDKKLQLKLLDGKDEPLSKIIEICKTFETAAENKQLLDKKLLKTEVNKIGDENAEDEKICDEIAVVKEQSCFNCGQTFNDRHRRYCPANNVTCKSCGRRGHFAKFCRSVSNEYVKEKKKQSKKTIGKQKSKERSL